MCSKDITINKYKCFIDKPKWDDQEKEKEKLMDEIF